MNVEKLKKIFDSIGVSVVLEAVDVPDLKLPIAFSARYDLVTASFTSENEKILFIKEKRPGSIESFIKQSERISQLAGLSYGLVFTEIPSKTRTLLLKTRVPFIDYKGNLFLPKLGMILSKEKNILNKIDLNLSASEQAVFIYLLLNREKSMQVKSIAKVTSVSVPSIYRFLRGFVERDWLISGYNQYRFSKSRIDIYEEALPFMTNPVRKSYFIEEDTLSKFQQYLNNEEIKISGLAALSQISLLDNFDTVYAISKKSFNEILTMDESINYSLFEKRIFDSPELQLWDYQPFSIGETNIVDPISLYLSLKDVEDPRIEIEIDFLKKNIINTLEENDAY